MSSETHAGEKLYEKTYQQDEIEERLTPDQRELIYKLMHPEGDPYTNGRELGFYCEQCG